MNIPSRKDLEDAGINIALAIPMERNISDLAFLGIVPILQKGYGYIGGSYARTDMGRNSIAQALMESHFTHVLMIDSDHIHPPDLVERLGRWVLADPKKRIVSGINFRRSPPYDPCVYIVEDGKLAAPMEWDAGIGKADAVGHGCILIDKTVFAELNYPYWAYSYTDEGSQSEDIYFCKQCRDAKIDIWVDTTTTSPHMVWRFITEADYKKYIAHAIEKGELQAPDLEMGQTKQRVHIPQSSIVIPQMKTKI